MVIRNFIASFLFRADVTTGKRQIVYCQLRKVVEMCGCGLSLESPRT